MLVSCGTTAPKPIQSNSIAFDGNIQNAGIIGIVRDKDTKEFLGFLVTPHLVDTYNALIVKYGYKFIPQLKINDEIALAPDKINYIISAQGMTYLENMIRWQRDGEPAGIIDKIKTQI